MHVLAIWWVLSRIDFFPEAVRAYFPPFFGDLLQRPRSVNFCIPAPRIKHAVSFWRLFSPQPSEGRNPSLRIRLCTWISSFLQGSANQTQCLEKCNAELSMQQTVQILAFPRSRSSWKVMFPKQTEESKLLGSYRSHWSRSELLNSGQKVKCTLWGNRMWEYTYSCVCALGQCRHIMIEQLGIFPYLR